MKESDVRKNHQSESNSEKNQVFQKFNRLIHFGVKGQKSKKSGRELLTISFIKKYINYAKNEVAPVLTQEASDYIAARYSELRSREDGTQDKYRVFFLFLLLDYAYHSPYVGNAYSIINSTC
jgi:DNA replicative helicase MCM subunit Mcm2 (Cdc46/Mcm family)